MPPQPGVFALPYASSHKSRTSNQGADVDMAYQHHGQHHHHHSVAGPSSRPHGGSMDDGRKEKKRKEIAGKLGKEMNDRRDDGRHYTDTISALHSTSMQLSLRPETVPLYNLRLYPISLERSALLAQYAVEEKYSLEGVQTAYEEERERVEDEWKRGRDRVRERLLEGIEERRRRAREEKEGEGTIGDAALDSQSRPHITRKLRNKLNTSPSPTPLSSMGASIMTGLPTIIPSLSTTASTPIPNPHSLSIDELPSPFPLSLTSVSLQPKAGGEGYIGSGGNGRRRPKGSGGLIQSQAGVGGLGKSLTFLIGSRESEVEADLGEIRRGNKRRRATAVAMGKS